MPKSQYIEQEEVSNELWHEIVLLLEEAKQHLFDRPVGKKAKRILEELSIEYRNNGAKA